MALAVPFPVRRPNNSAPQASVYVYTNSRPQFFDNPQAFPARHKSATGAELAKNFLMASEDLRTKLGSENEAISLNASYFLA
jgi:hypothetical protein